MSTSALGACTAVLTAAVLISACHYQPSPVPMRGEPADIAALAGRWSGDYVGEQSGRSGSISFTVTAGTDTAYGDVIMIPWRGQPLIAADAESRAHAMHASQPDVLRIVFVRVTGGFVEGALEPYVAPDCGCTVTTVFQGVASGNAIQGQFVTTGRMLGLRQEGRWSVERATAADDRH